MEEFDLSQFDDAYKTAQIAPNGFDPVPDGKYQVNVDKVELTRSRAGNPVLKWQLKILGPTCRNRILWHQNMIVNEKNIQFLKADLLTCGVDILPSQLAQDGRLNALLDLKLEVTKKTRAGKNPGDRSFEDVYLQRRLDPAKEVVALVEDDDPPPF
jgi:hypothetical protein